LGGLSIENSGSKDAAANRRPLALLALLAVNGSRGLSRDKVVALLWPESDAEHGRNSLSQVLSVLRRELAADDPVLGTVELRINTDVLACDVMEFEERIVANDLDAATRLYTGSFLDGVSKCDALVVEGLTSPSPRGANRNCGAGGREARRRELQLTRYASRQAEPAKEFFVGALRPSAEAISATPRIAATIHL
jgi:hypothetical protein